MSDRKFYKTIVTFVVLSEEPIEGMDLGAISYESDNGDIVRGDLEYDTTEISGITAAEMLYEVGSDPGFFQLDDNGNDSED